MNIGGVLMLSFIGSLAQSAAAQAAFAVVLHAALLVDYVDIGGIDGRGGGCGRSESRCGPARSRRRCDARGGMVRILQARRLLGSSFCSSRDNCSRSLECTIRRSLTLVFSYCVC